MRRNLISSFLESASFLYVCIEYEHKGSSIFIVSGKSTNELISFQVDVMGQFDLVPLLMSNLWFWLLCNFFVCLFNPFQIMFCQIERLQVYCIRQFDIKSNLHENPYSGTGENLMRRESNCSSHQTIKLHKAHKLLDRILFTGGSRGIPGYR